MNTALEIDLRLIDFVPILFAVSIAVFMTIGWFFGHYRVKRSKGTVTVRDSLASAIFGLSALVLGFTFSSASSHYDTQIENIRFQAHTIKELYDSTKYLQPSDQATVNKLLDALVDLHVTGYSKLRRATDIEIVADNVSSLVRQINETVITAVANAPEQNKAILAETISPQTRDLVTICNTAIIKAKSHPPLLIMRFLYALLCIGALLIGYTMAVKQENDWFLASVYIILMGLGLYVILSLEYPHLLMPKEEVNRAFLLMK